MIERSRKDGSYLEFKFCQSAILYIYEQDKINYIRDYYKNIAFEFIKSKANLIFVNIYFTVSEIIQDLKNMFGQFDKIAKSNALLYNPKFGMAIANLKKTFDKFFARFTSLIIWLDFTD